jgi:dipeptidyl aminopeptidase/acylaminoacyl peptidase
MSNDGIQLTSSLGLPPGRYALPATANPTQLVVMFHGHQNDSCSWRNHLREAAAKGAVAVAMDYSGQSDRVIPPYGEVENWGWAVRSGASDSIIAARHFLARYPSITQVFNFGTSMGGNVSGFALYSADAKRADCSPLWDYWVATEGVHNLTEEYLGTRTLTPVLVAAAQATQEIEEENGGTLEAVPARYQEITNTLQAAKLSFLKGTVLVHGTNDQTVPYDQSTQMANALRANGVPTHLYPVIGSDHVWEGSSDAKVMRVGLDELFRIMAGGSVSNGETPVQGP